MKTTIKIITLMAFAVLLLGSCSKRDPDINAKYKVEFSPVKPSSGGGITKPEDPITDKSFYVIAKIGGKEIESGTEVEAGREMVFTAYAGGMSIFRFEKWEVTGADIPDDKAETITIEVKGPLKVVGVYKSLIKPK